MLDLEPLDSLAGKCHTRIEPGRLDSQDRAIHLSEHGFGGVANKETGQSGSAHGSHDQEICLQLGGEAGDDRPRPASDHVYSISEVLKLVSAQKRIDATVLAASCGGPQKKTVGGDAGSMPSGHAGIVLAVS